MEVSDKTPATAFARYCFVEELWADESMRECLRTEAAARLQLMIAEHGGVQTVGEMTVRSYNRDDTMLGTEFLFGDKKIMVGTVMVIAEWRLTPLQPSAIVHDAS